MDKQVKVEVTVVRREYYTVEMVVPDAWEYHTIEEAALDQVLDGEVVPIDYETEVIDIQEEPAGESDE